MLSSKRYARIKPASHPKMHEVRVMKLSKKKSEPDKAILPNDNARLPMAKIVEVPFRTFSITMVS